MWKNRLIKRRARKTFRANYLAIAALCFVLTFFGVLSNFSTQFVTLDKTDVTNALPEPANALNDVNPSHSPEMLVYLNDFFAGSPETKQVAANISESFKDTGGLIYNLMYRTDQFIFTHDSAAKAMIMAAIIAYILYYFLLKNVLQVGFSRFLIETRTYSRTSMLRVFYLFKKGGVMRSIFTMLVRSLYLALLGMLIIVPFTISMYVFLIKELLWPILAGIALTSLLFLLFVYKFYALSMVPFILAENPMVSRKEAFRLSSGMMKKNKLHAIGLELSFIPWRILSVATFGIAGAVYVTPYRYLTFSELYMSLRKNAIDSNIEYSICLNDEFLTAPPAGMPGLENTLIGGRTELFPIKYPDTEPFKRNRFNELIEDMEPKRHYTILTLILFFFIFSFIGWCWEVSIHLVKDAVFVNRGSMFGPWLPIYGCGGVLIIALLKRLANKPMLLFISTILLCCTIEYSASCYLEKTSGMKYWDYSGYFLNLNGRICLEGALVFALAGLLFVYVAGPLLDNLLSGFRTAPKAVAAVILILLFGCDAVYSHFHPNQGKGITDYGYDGGQLYGVESVLAPTGETCGCADRTIGDGANT